MLKFQALLLPFLAGSLLGPLAASPVSAAAAVTPVQVTLDSASKVHPLLQFGALAEPSRVVHVIVQKTSPLASALLISLLVPGMQVDELFTVVPAFSAALPQSSVGILARNGQVRYVSPDGAVAVSPATPVFSLSLLLKGLKPISVVPSVKPPKVGFDGSTLLTTYPVDTGATAAWSAGHGDTATGAGINVAIIDSGIDATHADLKGQVTAVNVNRNTSSTGDGLGHGTHVAGIINGHPATGEYLGIAPSAGLISVKVADDIGRANESDLLRGLEWVYLNRARASIRALNLSVSTTVPQSYSTSPINAAVEHLWRAGVTVVTSAGNLGPVQDAVWYAPGNDPYVITVGCIDENETAVRTDDSICPISSRGVTLDGFAKPDLMAPGRKIASPLAKAPNGLRALLGFEFPDRITADGTHIRLSGTSMSAPMVTGAVALLLEHNPSLTPSQIKQVLMRSSRAYPGQADAAGMLNITAALAMAEHPPASTSVIVPVGGSAAPGSANTLVWDGARWGSAYWDGARWGSAYWDGARWGNAEWDGARWGSAYWNGARWGSAYWDGARWGSAAGFDGARWGSTEWDGARWG